MYQHTPLLTADFSTKMTIHSCQTMTGTLTDLQICQQILSRRPRCPKECVPSAGFSATACGFAATAKVCVDCCVRNPSFYNRALQSGYGVVKAGPF